MTVALRCERYAVDARLPFVVPHARRIRAMAELGLRHTSRCKQLLDWLDREAAKSGDVFLEVESRLIRCRLLIVQGLAARGVETLKSTSKRFPFVGERGEFLATLALALACSGQRRTALRLVNEAQEIARTIEVRTLVPCVHAIVALESRSPDGRPWRKRLSRLRWRPEASTRLLWPIAATRHFFPRSQQIPSTRSS